MIVRGPEYINEKMKLKPGDRFLVSLSYDEDEDWNPLLTNTPNTCEDMLEMNGRWGTVNRVGELETYYEEDGTIVEGFPHYADTEVGDDLDGMFESWSWNWFHMEAVDIHQTRPLPPISETLPDI